MLGCEKSGRPGRSHTSASKCVGEGGGCVLMLSAPPRTAKENQAPCLRALWPPGLPDLRFYFVVTEQAVPVWPKAGMVTLEPILSGAGAGADAGQGGRSATALRLLHHFRREDRSPRTSASGQELPAVWDQAKHPERPGRGRAPGPRSTSGWTCHT